MPRSRPSSRTDRPGAALAAATLALGVLAPATVAGAEADAERGRLLYESFCVECHTSRVHIRERRKADSPSALRAWVERWRTELALPWDEQEIDDVTAWLARRWYDFPQPE